MLFSLKHKISSTRKGRKNRFRKQAALLDVTLDPHLVSSHPTLWSPGIEKCHSQTERGSITKGVDNNVNLLVSTWLQQKCRHALSDDMVRWLSVQNLHVTNNACHKK
jgi:hypothetical protein